jgi:peptidoglycan/LPS O-acetylase OafA/YrhL
VLPALAGLRFYAAMHIVLLHTFRAGWLPDEVARLARWGGSTVSLFFILSGFILTWVYATPGGGLRVPAPAFLRRRLLRLYPTAMFCHLLTVPLVWYAYGPVERWLRAAATVTGVQAYWTPFADSFNTPGWSLSFLALCYLLLPPVLRWTAGWGPRRLVLALAALWAAMLIPAAAYAVIQPADPLWMLALFTFPPARLPEFLFGVVVARLLMARAWPPLPAWTAPVAAGLLVGTLVLTPEALFAMNHNGLWAPLHGVLLWALAAGTPGWMHRLLGGPACVRLGSASFAIYMVHVPLYAWMLRLSGDVASWSLLPSAAFYLVYLMAVVVLGLALHRAVERLTGRAGTPAPAAAVPVAAAAAPAVAALR